jgi:hypothetical protein
MQLFVVDAVRTIYTQKDEEVVCYADSEEAAKQTVEDMDDDLSASSAHPATQEELDSIDSAAKRLFETGESGEIFGCKLFLSPSNRVSVEDAKRFIMDTLTQD